MPDSLDVARDIIERVGRRNATRGAGADTTRAVSGVVLHNDALAALLEHAAALEARVHTLERWIERHVSPTSVPTLDARE